MEQRCRCAARSFSHLAWVRKGRGWVFVELRTSISISLKTAKKRSLRKTFWSFFLLDSLKPIININGMVRKKLKSLEIV